MQISKIIKKEGLFKYTDSLPFPILIIDNDYNVLFINRKGREVFRSSEEDKIKCYEISHSLDKPCWEVFGEDLCPVKKLREKKEPYTYHDHEQQEIHILVASKVDKDIFMELFLDTYISDIIKQLRFLADIDSLTGFYNRRKIEEILNTEIERAKRYKDPLSVMFIDIDNFKKINDTYGHKKGDEVLQKVAQIIKKAVRKTDFVGRFGGEEFIVVLPETSPEKAFHVAQRIRKSIETANFGVNGITVSIGISGLREEDDYGKLFVRVDRAMYLAKRKGKNRIELL